MILSVLKGRPERGWLDIEIPEEFPIEQLKDMLGMYVYGETSDTGIQYILEGKLPEGMWFPVRNVHHVAEAGLHEGCSLRIQRSFSTTEEEAPVYGRRNLFQNDENGVIETLNLDK